MDASAAFHVPLVAASSNVFLSGTGRTSFRGRPVITHPTSLRRPNTEPRILKRRVFEVSCTASVVSTPADVQKFVDFMVKNGAPLSPQGKFGVSKHKLTVKPCKDGNGLFATEKIGKGETIIQIPAKLTISASNLEKTPLADLTEECDEAAAIALFLLYEKSLGAKSFWGPYIDILPAAIDSPLLWSDPELAELAGSPTLSAARKRISYLEGLQSKLKGRLDTSLDDLKWAYVTVTSRAGPATSPDDKKSKPKLVLGPYVDLLNHSDKTSSRPSFQKSGLLSRELNLRVDVDRPYGPGEQVYITYGDRVNGELLLDYGFVVGDKADGVAFPAEIEESQRFFDDKADVLQSAGLATSEIFRFTPSNPEPENMLPFLRLQVLAGKDAFHLEAIFRSDVWSSHLALPVTRNNEEAVCDLLISYCESTLAAYPTSLAEDAALCSQGVTGRAGKALQVRMGEKRTLEAVLDAYKERAKKLEDVEYYQERRLRELDLLDYNPDDFQTPSRSSDSDY